VLARGAEGVGPRMVREAMAGGRQSQIGNTVQAEQHHGPPLLDGDAPVVIGLFEVHHDVCARPRCPHSGDLRPGIEGLIGDQWPVQHNVVLAVHPTAGALPRGRREIGPGGLLRFEDEDHWEHGRYGQAVQHSGGLIAGGSGIGATISSLITHAPSPAQKLYIPQLAW
jgi:hypothetical protein